MENRLYNAKRDVPDARDSVAPHLPFIQGNGYVSLEEWLPEARDQGRVGSCTAFAGCGILSWNFKRFKNKDLVFSPLFMYRSERVLEDTTDEDAGAQSRTMAKVLTTYGVPLESSFPYDQYAEEKPTPFSLLAEARQYKLDAYHRVPDLETLKSVLASGYVASLGIQVFESFEGNQAAETGLVPVPNPRKEKFLGGHEIFTYGFDDSKKVLLVQNSWGTSWGIKGRCEIPYDFWPFVMDSYVPHFQKW